MGTISCSVKYFWLGALLIFAGSVLLCALGFTVVLPHQATRDWFETTCNVTSSGYDGRRCSCGQQKADRDNCVTKYPCLVVRVAYRNASGHVITNAMLFRHWTDSFYDRCTLYECGDERWNNEEASRFKYQWGHPGQRYSCFYDPDNSRRLVLERTPVSHMIHSLLWPIIALLTGLILWLGLCMGCWEIEKESYPQTLYYSPPNRLSAACM